MAELFKYDGQPMLPWLNERLSAILDFPVPQDLTEYILAIENARDLEDYLRTLLNFSNPQHQQFYLELLQRRQARLTGPVFDAQGYKKSEVDQNYILPKQNEKKKKGKGQGLVDGVSPKETVKETPHEKKKTKFVNLYSQEGQMKDVILLKGRHHCDCQASKHLLVNNCLKCGRIVCEQEGSGPCLVCNNLVCSREEQEVLRSDNKQANQLYQKLIEKKKPIGWEDAILHRNRLLEYDRTSEKRTKVIDDESDYFSINSVWLSKSEREKLKKREEEIQAHRHASRLERKVKLDFAGRQVVQELEDYYDKEEDMVLKEIERSVNNSNRSTINDSQLHPGITCPQPVFQELADNRQPRRYQTKHSRFLAGDKVHNRIQDREFLEMSDGGRCLSMHQPWASLLTTGIKLHEGRTWYTSHRGRLWIAATAKHVDPQCVQEVEQMYRVLKNDDLLKFPSQYPVGCLLGCVNVLDCLPQEEYRIKFPEGESDSPFVFICQEPIELPIRFPIQGKHKIYNLEPKILQAAQKALQRIARLQAERMLDN